MKYRTPYEVFKESKNRSSYFKEQYFKSKSLGTQLHDIDPFWTKLDVVVSLAVKKEWTKIPIW